MTFEVTIRPDPAVFLDHLHNEVREVLWDGGVYVMNKAKDNAPVKTGKLRDSIKMREESWDVIVIYTDTLYAKFVEEGTSKMKAQPYMRPAWEDGHDYMSARFDEMIERMENEQY